MYITSNASEIWPLRKVEKLSLSVYLREKSRKESNMASLSKLGEEKKHNEQLNEYFSKSRAHYKINLKKRMNRTGHALSKQ